MEVEQQGGRIFFGQKKTRSTCEYDTIDNARQCLKSIVQRFNNEELFVAYIKGNTVVIGIRDGRKYYVPIVVERKEKYSSVLVDENKMNCVGVLCSSGKIKALDQPIPLSELHKLVPAKQKTTTLSRSSSLPPNYKERAPPPRPPLRPPPPRPPPGPPPPGPPPPRPPPPRQSPSPINREPESIYERPNFRRVPILRTSLYGQTPRPATSRQQAAEPQSSSLSPSQSPSPPPPPPPPPPPAPYNMVSVQGKVPTTATITRDALKKSLRRGECRGGNCGYAIQNTGNGSVNVTKVISSDPFVAKTVAQSPGLLGQIRAGHPLKSVSQSDKRRTSNPIVTALEGSPVLTAALANRRQRIVNDDATNEWE